LSRFFHKNQLAIVQATGVTRFDALALLMRQDFMESGTPGLKSTEEAG